MRLFTMLLLVLSLRAQSFEVATIKPSPSTVTQTRYPRLRNGTLSAEHVTVRNILQIAWGKISLQIAGPPTLDAEFFDLAGKAPDGVPDTAIGPLLQALLKDRFHMEAHLEMRQMPVFAMVPAKDGVKLKPFDPANPPNPVNRGGSALVGVGTTAQLASLLSNSAGRPVIDKVGIDERLTYIVYYMPISAQPAEGAADPGIPDLFTAVQQQLGVKLEPRTEPVEVLVIDHADRLPSAN